MLEANDYSIRDGKMPGDDFRIFLTPPELDVESEEVFKVKGMENVCCGAVILLGGEIREDLYKLNEEGRKNFRKFIESATGVENLDFFEIDDDGKDFKIVIRTEFPIGTLSGETFGNAMDRLNLAGGSIEDRVNEFFDKDLSS